MRESSWREKHDTIKACKRYIDAHIREKLDLHFLAKQYSYSYNAFREAFKDVAQYTPHNYIRMRRCQMAAQYMREGRSVTEAAELVGFETLAGFYKAFLDVYGITPQEFQSTRGRCLMAGPTLREIADFHIVGYILERVEDMRPEERGAYWIVRECPDVSFEEYSRIGGGADMAGFWVNSPDGGDYVMGPPVDAVRYVPADMEAQAIPGGLFLEFPVPGPTDTFILYENVRAAWYFARQQWLPNSAYEEDASRIAYEYYNGKHTSVFIPIKEKHTAP